MGKISVSNKLLVALISGGIVFSSPLKLHNRIIEDAYATPKPETSIEEVVEEEEPQDNKRYSYIPAVMATDSVNVRIGPTVDSDIIGGLTPNTTMPLIEKGVEWDKINYYGQEAYVNNKYLEDTKIPVAEPIKIVYCTEDTILTEDETNIDYLVPVYELGVVYDETNDYYLAAVNNMVGLLPKDATQELEGSYAVVDISDQRVDVYNDDELLLTTPCVTGKDETPTTVGCHTIYAEKHHDYLRGNGYESYVDHFLAFYDGEGLHDASWRSIFGTNDFHENGSHGCVNLPSKVIEEVNDMLDTGDHVLVKR